MISERLLRKWRREALNSSRWLTTLPADGKNVDVNVIEELCQRILRLTQELMDQHLLRKG